MWIRGNNCHNLCSTNKENTAHFRLHQAQSALHHTCKAQVCADDIILCLINTVPKTLYPPPVWMVGCQIVQVVSLAFICRLKGSCGCNSYSFLKCVEWTNYDYSTVLWETFNSDGRAMRLEVILVLYLFYRLHSRDITTFERACSFMLVTMVIIKIETFFYCFLANISIILGWIHMKQSYAQSSMFSLSAHMH